MTPHGSTRLVTDGLLPCPSLTHLLSAEALCAVPRLMPLVEIQERPEGKLGSVGTALDGALVLVSTTLVRINQA